LIGVNAAAAVVEARRDQAPRFFKTANARAKPSSPMSMDLNAFARLFAAAGKDDSIKIFAQTRRSTSRHARPGGELAVVRGAAAKGGQASRSRVMSAA
jgi:hypothetical protein